MTRIAYGRQNVVGGVHAMPYSPALRIGDHVFVSGQVPIDEHGRLVGGTIEDQTRQVMENIRRLLTQAGCTMADVVKTTVFLADARDFWLFNKVYAGYLADPPPARSTVQAGMILDIKVEIEAIAYKPLGSA